MNDKNAVEVKKVKQYDTSWILLLALLTSLGPLSIDMYIPAFPEMANDFQVSPHRIANTLAAYFLGLALGQLVYGPISDRIGRKKPLYFGLALYCVASLACIIAPNEWALIFARFIQALGGCVGVVMARAAIRDRLDLQSSSQAFSSMMIVMGIAPVVAPIIGAFILEYFSWHAIFITLTFIGLFCLICVHLFFEETLPNERRMSISTNQVLILYRAIFLDPSFRLPMLVGCLTGAALFSYISSASAVFMLQYGLNSTQFSYAFGFIAFGIMMMSSINKRLANRFSVMARLKFGGLQQLVGASIIVVAGLMDNASFVLVMFGIFLTVSGLGFTGPNSMALAMSKQGARAGTASAIMGSAQFGCGLLGGVILNFLFGSALMNMGIMMFGFVLLGCICILRLSKNLANQIS